MQGKIEIIKSGIIQRFYLIFNFLSVKRAGKCKSTGVKCILPSTTTSTETTIITSTISTSTFRSTSKGPTPPPLTTNTISSIRRRTRPTPPPKMPGHRPQRPKQWKSTTTTTKRPKIVSLVTDYPLPVFVPLISKKNSSFGNNNNNNNNGDGSGGFVGSGGGDSDNNDNNDMFNGDYADETEEPQIETTLIPSFKHFSTSTTQIYEEEDLIDKTLKKQKGGLEKKKLQNKINKNLWTTSTINSLKKVIKTFLLFFI